MPTVTLTVPWVRTSALSTLTMSVVESSAARLTPITSFDQTYSLRTVTANTNTYVLSTGTMTYLQAMSAQLITTDFDFTFVVTVNQTLTVIPLVSHAFIQILARPFVFHSLASQDPFLFHSRLANIPMIFHQRGVREMELITQILMPVTTFDQDRSTRTPTITSAYTTVAGTLTYTQVGPLASPGVGFDFTVV